MISEEQEERGTWWWAWLLPLSALLHLLVLPLALWIFAPKLLLAQAAPQPREEVVASTAVRLERRTVPNKMGAPARPAAQAAPQLPMPAQRALPNALPQAVPTEPPTPTPLPSATPSPTPRKAQSAPLTAQIATQAQTYQREVAELKRKNDPLSIATLAPQPPQAYHRSAFDVSGPRERESAQALLFVNSHWMEGGMSCYYVRYAAQFSNGATEEGEVPWPVCYAPGDDRFAKYPGRAGVPLPIPYPQPGYVLPKGTYLSQFLMRIYRQSPASP